MPESTNALDPLTDVVSRVLVDGDTSLGRLRSLAEVGAEEEMLAWIPMAHERLTPTAARRPGVPRGARLDAEAPPTALGPSLP